MQIRPNQPLPIVYVISDPSDTATYFVRTVVRNSATGVIIKINNSNFVNLTVDPTNSRRFSKLITAPIDSSGNGFFIDVTTTVYTDSGYTTKSTLYQEDNKVYLVLDLWTVALGSGGGRGGWTENDKEKIVDYDRIKKLILEVVADLQPKEVAKPLDISPLIQKIDTIISSHQHLASLPKDLSSLRERVESLPKFKETDLQPVHKGINDFIGKLNEAHSQLKDHFANSLKETHGHLHTLLVDHFEKATTAVKKTIQDMDGLKFTYNVEAKPLVDKVHKVAEPDPDRRVKNLFP